jgi:hypothetical protein
MKREAEKLTTAEADDGGLRRSVNVAIEGAKIER